MVSGGPNGDSSNRSGSRRRQSSFVRRRRVRRPKAPQQRRVLHPRNQLVAFRRFHEHYAQRGGYDGILECHISVIENHGNKFYVQVTVIPIFLLFLFH